MTVDQDITAAQIGTRIAEAIDSRDANFTRVAADIGVSEATLRRFIKGTSDISYLQILRLSRLLDLSPDWFVNGKVAA